MRTRYHSVFCAARPRETISRLVRLGTFCSILLTSVLTADVYAACGGDQQSACDIFQQIIHKRKGCDAGLAEIFIPACGTSDTPDCQGIATTWCSARRDIGETCGLGAGNGVPCKSGLTCELVSLFEESRCYAKLDENFGPTDCLATFSRGILNQAIAGDVAWEDIDDGGEGKTMNFGYGGQAAAGIYASGERGVLYTRDGCYGCYVSNCEGVTATIGFTASVVEGESIEHMFCPEEGNFCSNAPARGCDDDNPCASDGQCLPCNEAGGSSLDTTTEIGLFGITSVGETASVSNCDSQSILGPQPGECIPTGHSQSFSVGIAIGSPVNVGVAECSTTVIPAGCLEPDDNGEIGPDSTFVTDLNQAPTCSAVAVPTACTGSTTTVALSGSGSSDPDGSIQSYAWQSSCGGTSFSNAGAASPNLTIDSTSFTQYTNTGTVECSATLTLTDNDGATSQCSTSVVVYDDVKPSITAPADILQQHTKPLPNTVALGSPVVSDACDKSLTPTNNAPAEGFGLGDTIVTWTVTDGAGLSNTATQKVTLLNSAPTNLAPGSLGLPEDSSKSFTLAASDINGDNIDFAVTTGPSKGSLTGTIPNLTYTPAANYYGTDSFTFTATDEHGKVSSQSVAITVTPVNDLPSISVDRSSASVEYSDTIGSVTITASDIDDTSLTISSSFTDSTPAPLGADLPNGLSYVGGCTEAANPAPAPPGTQCSWTLSGAMLENAGDYVVGFKVTDSGGGTGTPADASASTAIAVAAEQATVALDDGNAAAIQVETDGGASPTFTLRAFIEETEPDLATYEARAGDLTLAGPSMVLVPVGPGGPVSPGSCSEPVSGSGYAQVMTFTCEFHGVPVNTYSVEVSLAGTYYQGADDDVFTVYDPSLGFTTGGGWFIWPGTGEKTNFGYTIQYGKKGSNPKGSLLLIRHVGEGLKYRIKSNALEGLSLGEDTAVPMGWAAFNGKTTYRDPEMEDAEGNHGFTVYVEDRDEPGVGTDRIWLEIRDKDGQPIADMTMDGPGPDNALEIGGGNIVVPHREGKGGKRGDG